MARELWLYCAVPPEEIERMTFDRMHWWHAQALEHFAAQGNASGG